jgi:MoaA/NifB/PqqE/SkfB family radical SAM enzyme
MRMATCLGKYLVVDRIEFIVTYLCNSKCSHCQLDKEEKGKMFPSHVDEDKAGEIVREVGQAYAPKSIMTFGGEPLLYPEIVCAIHEQAKKVGIPIRDVITNGFWSTKAEKIQEIAQNLAKSGVNEVSISVDCFHQEFIPLKTVKKTANSLIAAGIERVSWNPCWVVSKDHDNEYNRRTKTILQKLRNLQVEESEGNSVQPKGRARSSLTEFFPPRTSVPKGKCGEMPYTEVLDSVKTISVEPDGRVAVCENFYIGNAFKSNIIDILENYDPFRIPEAKSILEEGMDGLTKWAKNRGVEPRPEGYYNICHMCTDLRERTSTACSNSSSH